MTLTEIEYGSLASSATLNNNFKFLQDKITELSTLITSQTASYSSTVATLNNSVSSLLDCSESFIKTGTIIISQASTIPSGFLLCDGSEILIADYEELYSVIGTTYGQTDSTSFCIPNLKNKTIFGKSETTTLGSYLEAGLPNITGTFNFGLNGIVTTGQNGCFSGNSSGTMIGGSGAWSSGNATCSMDASKSNDIYGNSITVQPPALITNFLIKY